MLLSHFWGPLLIALNKVVQIDEARIEDHLGELVRAAGMLAASICAIFDQEKK